MADSFSMFDLNEPVYDDGDGNGMHFFLSCACTLLSFSLNRFLYHCFLTGFDLNLPLDEYGAVDFDFVENLTGT